jgi:hypothetical protein
VKSTRHIQHAIGKAAPAWAAMALTAAAAFVAAPAAGAAPSQQDVAITLARAQQLGTLETLEAVDTTAAGARAALDPGARAAGGEPAAGDETELMVGRGRFADVLAKVPPGAPAPAGRVVAFVVDRGTGAVAAMYIGDRLPPIGPLGSVSRMALSRAASASAVPRSIVQRRRRGPRARAAAWGQGCARASGHHCYAFAEWAMSGGEAVEGTETMQRTTNMNVAGWANGDFVTNEEWTTFPSTGYWLEAGQQAGEYKGCCSLFWFYAFKNATGYYQYTSPPYVWEVTPNTWNNYAMKASGNGIWCFYVGPTWEQQIACEAGFSTYSTLLQDGAEFATESKPVNAGSVQANATWLNGTVHTWNRASNQVTTAGLCVSQYQPVNFPGNINYGTC